MLASSIFCFFSFFFFLFRVFSMLQGSPTVMSYFLVRGEQQWDRSMGTIYDLAFFRMVESSAVET